MKLYSKPWMEINKILNENKVSDLDKLKISLNLIDILRGKENVKSMNG